MFISILLVVDEMSTARPGQKERTAKRGMDGKSKAKLNVQRKTLMIIKN